MPVGRLRHRMMAAAVIVAAVVISDVCATAQTSPTPAPATTPAPPPDLACISAPKATTLSSANVVANATASARKSWQPIGGRIDFAIHSSVPFNSGARILACVRWKTDGDNKSYAKAEVVSVDLSAADKTTLKLSLIVPSLAAASESDPTYAYALPNLHLVPLADVLILILNPGESQPFAVSTVIGITHPLFALIAVAAVFVATFGWLWYVIATRLRKAGVPKVNPLLTVITTPSGYASLSQFQIVLWTFVVLLSAVYVMSLSGELIEITTGTLILLGISGATTVGSKIYTDSQPNAGGQQSATIDPGHPKPLWADLITNTNQGQLGIDVTRVQMLFFTLITAFFVGLRVITTYVIPEIPDGFQILMGISNAVYMGSKVTQKQS
jgi:hypothetical protein